MDRTSLNRRRFVQSAVVTGAAAYFAEGLEHRAVAQATPGANADSLAELRVAVARLPLSMDPQENSGNASQRVHYFTYDTLIRPDFLNGNGLVPGLATAWRRVDDTTFELDLRRDVMFQDGSPFTALDVEYTFGRILSNDPTLQANTDLFPFVSVKALDDFRVRIVTDGVDPVVERRLTDTFASIIPAAYHQRVGTDEFRTSPIGTGPYRLVEYVADDHLTFEAHADYFGGAPAAEQVTVRLIPEVATRVAAILNDEVDLITDVPPDQLASLQDDDQLVVKTVPLANVSQTLSNMTAKPMDNKAVRQALYLAIDRKALVEQLWGGNAVHARGFQFEGEEFYNPERPLIPYDPDRARALLAEGGYAGEEIVYLGITPDYYVNERVAAEAIVAMWREVGVNARVETVEVAQIIEEWSRPDSPYHVSSWSASSNGDPDSYLLGGWGPESFAQDHWWADESAARFNKLGQEARSSLDFEERFALYQQMLDEWEAEAPGTSLYVPKGIYAMRANIDWTPYPLYYMDLRPYNFKVRS
jgi:peptide/nickel transport system substrate-binding protein